MSAPRRWLAPSVLGVCLFTTLSVWAGIPARVLDEANFFSSTAIDKANEKVKEIDREFQRTLLIETVAAVPDDQRARLKSLGNEKFFAEWGVKRAQQAGVKGIYMLFCKSPGQIQIEIDKATRAKAFTYEDRARLGLKLVALMKQKKYDDALQEAVDFVQTTLRSNSVKPRALAPPARPAAAPFRPAAPAAKHVAPEQNSILTWVILGLIVFVGLWIVMAIFRAIFRGLGGGGGAAGGPTGYGGGYGGGGGGGFMTSLMGGIFGAAAGNWLYDSFFRGGHASAGYDSQAYGAPSDTGAPGAEPGAGDFSGDDGGGFGFDTDDSGGGGFDSGGDFGGGGFDSGGGDF